MAERYALGVEKHGTHNWLKGGADPHYLTQVFDHVIDHLLRYRDGVNKEDDHLGAAMWGLAALCEFEERGHCSAGSLGLPPDSEVYGDRTKKETKKANGEQPRPSSGETKMGESL